MARMLGGLRGLAFLLFFLFEFCDADSGGRNCASNSSLVGFESEFLMVQHQLRGVMKVINDCSFTVSEFDMIEGADVHWWGALGDAFENLTTGFVISDQPLNRTYKNESFVVVLNNITLDQIKVVAVWDTPTGSDFGHVLLENPRNGSNPSSNSSASSSNLAPSPSPLAGNSSVGGKNRVYEQPTMFDNCKILANNYRLRWTLAPEENLIDIGLEAAQESQYYMAFGWANRTSSSEFMLHADVAVTGFTEEGIPFADDYYITRYSECLMNKDGKVQGVCPDTIYEGSAPIGLVDNTKLVYGHRKDGVSFIRYQRPLKSIDTKYDLTVNYTDNMTVIWALGLIRPPDALRPYYLPQNHGGPPLVTYGHLVLNVSEHVNDCLGPLEAEQKEDRDLIYADGKTPLIVTTSPAVHYPNPPNPSKVLYINKKESPVLRVERGVPVKFSIQAGHDVALYITSDPIGGNATSRNTPETIYAGGPEAEGVPASPTELVWSPDRNTPDQVYYQSFYEQKMGWKVQVVDGGLSDMYNNSVVLDDQQVTFFWTLSGDSISIAARGEKKSGYLAVAFGGGMVNSYAYVGWVDNDGKGHVNAYWIDGKEAISVHPTNENLTHARCKSENGIITFEFTRPLQPSCALGSRPECNNIIDPTTPLKVVWAMGARWSEDHLSERNMHSITSSRPVRVLLMRGSAEAEQDLRPVLAVHGFMMFVAWGILLPGGILAARYLKHLKGDGWFQIHVYLQYSGLAIVVLGVLFAAAELRGFFINSVHVKFGVIAILLGCFQPVNAYLRPKRPDNGEVASSKRILWEYLHVMTGRCAIVAGIAALISGMNHLGDRYGGETVHGLNWALIIWFLMGALLVVYLENGERKRRRDRSFGKSNWVLGNIEEDDSTDLLHSNGTQGLHSSQQMEVQLEPLNR
ncbi:PREDICTED: cytochrome b561, DM13 and DOMON domain-containing protein At5g54830 [Nelumbo nucifera]|uniref:Cytochrome b561, DM13 and DOMON domain-containing protein At5g54830 n=1 Tax=Nelumbo nucifera TaxID=4432 RepID=A0A1U8BGP6_NELNU|nr:PREDICTED: cytochrome b561, DM13 and DOMON domain-containing protein At5g54830 [Nelumbo nucifera]